VRPDADPPGPGWRAVESDRETVLDVGPARVTVETVVFEDEDLRRRVREATGIDRTWRFAFAGTVDVPGSSDSGTLRRLVADRARRGFADRLRDRGFEGVDRAGDRSLDGTTAARYVARVRVDGVAADAEGWLAVRPAGDRRFRLAGGAYPRGVAPAPNEATATALGELFDPGRFREELFGFLQ
jgi:hypothetical protein